MQDNNYILSCRMVRFMSHYGTGKIVKQRVKIDNQNDNINNININTYRGGRSNKKKLHS